MEEQKKKRGRKCTYSLEKADLIIKYLEAGNTRKASYEALGIDDRTFYRWIEKYDNFAYRIKEAEARAEIRNVAISNKAAQTSWQASAWWLERRRKEDYGKKEQLDLTTNGKDLHSLSDEELDKRLDELINKRREDRAR
jgi:hypothetical protein